MPSRRKALKDEITVRAYRRTDLDSCRRLWQELTETHREIYGDPTIGGGSPGLFFDEHLRRAGAKRIWVAERRDEVVGLVGLLVEREDAEIEPLVVTRSTRGHGVGRALVKQAVAAAKGVRGVKFVSVRPVARNKEAIEFFRKQGLANIGRVELFMDLAGRKWKKGLQVHDLEFGY